MGKFEKYLKKSFCWRPNLSNNDLNVGIWRTGQYTPTKKSRGGGGGGGTWVNFCWVCAAGLLEPLLHYSLYFRGQYYIDSILVTSRQICNFRDPNY